MLHCSSNSQEPNKLAAKFFENYYKSQRNEDVNERIWSVERQLHSFIDFITKEVENKLDKKIK